LNVVLEVQLDDELELDDYVVNFRRMFGDARMDAVLGSVDGSVRFFGLTPTSMKLEGLDRHHRLLDSYKKLHAARGKVEHAHMRRIAVAFHKAFVDARARGIGGKQPRMQPDGEHDALPVAGIRRHEKGPLGQAAVGLHFRDVLVLQRQAIDLQRMRRARSFRCGSGFVRLRPRPALARIARDGVDDDGVVRGQQTASVNGRSSATAAVG
jgi:hypothetical protein